MVTVRKELPGRLNQFSAATASENAAETQIDLEAWLQRLKQEDAFSNIASLEQACYLTLEREINSTVEHRTDTFAMGDFSIKFSEAVRLSLKRPKKNKRRSGSSIC